MPHHFGILAIRRLFLGLLLLSTFFHACASVLKTDTVKPTTSLLVVRGILDSSGNKLVKIEPPVLYKANSATRAVLPATGRFYLLVQYRNHDSTLTYFDGLVSGDRSGQGSQYGFFEVQAIVPKQEVQLVKVLESKTGKVLASFQKESFIHKH